MTKDQLALDGGIPVRTAPFPTWPTFDEREEQQLLDVLRSGNWSVFTGDKVKTFQERFATYQDAQFATCVPNGTLALELGIMALDLQPGDEVIVPAYTFIATVSSALRLGIKPIFVDIDLDTYTLNPELLERAVTPQTRAIIPVHLAGRPANMDGILAAAGKYNLHVIEDACQAWGAEWRGKRVGALGDLGAFSFQNGKNITAGEGGAVLTNNSELHERCWSLHNVGRTRNDPWYHHERLGLNLRMTEWQGAVLLAQLERLEEHYPQRIKNARYLAEGLTHIDGLEALPEDPFVTRQAYHLIILRYKPEAFGGQPAANFINALAAEGITPISPGYVPLHQTPAIRASMKARFEEDSTKVVLPNTEYAASHSIWIAQNALLGDQEDMEDILAAVKKIQSNWS